MAATIKDISRETGLSVATISKYLNGGNLLPKNYEVIKQSVERNNYTINSIAKGLKTRKSNIIGVLTSSLDNIYDAKITVHIEDYLRSNGYGTLICDYRGDDNLIYSCVEFLISKNVDGIICFPYSNDGQFLQTAIKKSIPVVCIDKEIVGIDCDNILVDNVKIAYIAVTDIIKKNYKRIGIICGPKGISTSDDRLRGYCDALKDANMKINEKYISQGGYEAESSKNRFKEMMALPEPPDAIFFTNYYITIAGLIAINELGLEVPSQLAVVGYDNFELTQVFRPKIAIVAPPVEELAKEASSHILGRINGALNGSYETVILDAQYISEKSL